MNNDKIKAPAPNSLMVSDLTPHLVPVFDALMRFSRSLMDATNGSEDLFDDEFGKHARVLNLVPMNHNGFTVVSMAQYNLSHGLKELAAVLPIEPDVEVVISSNANEPQRWLIKFCGATLAEKILADRVAWGKLPEGAKPPRPDEGWRFTNVAMAQFVSQSDGRSLKFLEDLLVIAVKSAERIVEGTKNPDYARRALALKNAQWAGAFAKKASAVLQDQPAQSADPMPGSDGSADLPGAPSIDVSALMGRLSSESRKFKPG